MKTKNLWIALIIIWSLFIIWEVFAEIWAANEPGPVIRVDLILFIPILAMPTAIILYKIYRRNRNK